MFLWRNDADNNIMFAGRDPVDQQADTLALSVFAPVNNGNIHCKHYPDAPDVSNTALDPYIWRGASMTGGGIHSSEDFWHWCDSFNCEVQEPIEVPRLCCNHCLTFHNLCWRC